MAAVSLITGNRKVIANEQAGRPPLARAREAHSSAARIAVRRQLPRVAVLFAWLLSLSAQPTAAQSNTWIELSPTPATRWVPTSFTDCTGTQVTANPQARAYSGIAIGNGKILYWGGGHQGYPGNDVDLYDIATNRWIPDSRQPECLAPCCTSGADRCDNDPPGAGCPLIPYNGSCLVGSCVIRGGTGCSKTAYRCLGGTRDGLLCSQDGDCPGGGSCSVGKPTPGVPCATCRPYTEHTYQHQVYNPVRGKFLIYAFSGTYEWDPSNRNWIRLGDPPPESGDQASRLILWDPSGSRMLFIQTGGGSKGVFAWSYASNRWTLIDSYVPSSAGWPAMFGTWDGRARKFVITYTVSGVNRWFTYDPSLIGAAAWAEVTSGTPADLTVNCGGGDRPCWANSVTYDAASGVTVALAQDEGNLLALWAYDVPADTWAKIPTSGGSGAANVTGYPNTLVYDSGTASLYLLDRTEHYWVNGGAGEARTLKIRLALDATPPPTNTPAATETPAATLMPSATPTNPGPPPPTPTSGTPGACPGRVLQVGPGRTYAKPSEAAADVQANDCVHIDAGNYANDVARWPASASNVTIKGVNGMVKLTITDGVVYGSKGIWVVGGANTTIENVEFSCATSRTNNDHCSGVLVGDENDAGIRLEAPGLTVRNCIFHDNDNGILGGPNTASPVGDVLIENSEFFRNGFGDGYSHNLYLNKHNASLTFRYNYTHGAITGHNLKTRAARNYILYNRIMDERNGISSCTDPGTCSASAEIDVPCGGLSYVIGNVIEKGSMADSKDMIKFAAELSSPSCPQPSDPIQELYAINNTLVSNYGGSANFIRGFGVAPVLWAKNNIFFGSGTPIAWPAGGTIEQAGNVSENPNLLSPATYDYHLTAGSGAVINRGVEPDTDARGYALRPTLQYVYDRRAAPRPTSGALDVGAFEYVAAVTAVATPTNTPINTPTPTPVWTATPSEPIYCSSGQLEAVYPVAKSADDGAVRAAGTDYDALVPAEPEPEGYADYYDFATRKNVNGRYVVQLVAWRWDTSARPDGSSWPAGTQVVGSFVRPYWIGKGSGTAPLAFEWHTWPPPAALSTSDWKRDPPSPSDATFAGTTSMPAAKGRETIALSNAATNVNLAGHTGLRMSIADTTAPAVGEENSAGVRPRDYLTHAGDQSAQLVVCYVLSSPRPTPPHLL